MGVVFVKSYPLVEEPLGIGGSTGGEGRKVLVFFVDVGPENLPMGQ